jgi:hypothetical protein
MWTIGIRNITGTTTTGDLAFYVLLLAAAFIVVVAGHLFSLIVMGGASRNLVMHLLWNEPVLVRTTYAAVKSRFWSLLGAAIIVMFWLAGSSMIGFLGGWVAILLAGLMIVLGQVAPVWIVAIVAVLGAILLSAVFLWVFFFMVGKVAYVPQVLLVEGRGVFDSLSRSFSLARGNVRRLMAMTFFITFATYSALMILVIPLGWYGYLNGIDPSPWNATQWPFWYAIGYGVLEPLSAILLAPVWMLGMSLLYVDERVRHEGYDIELMASQKLMAMPDVNVTSPFAPAISVAPNRLPLRPPQTGSVLGLR